MMYQYFMLIEAALSNLDSRIKITGNPEKKAVLLCWHNFTECLFNLYLV